MPSFSIIGNHKFVGRFQFTSNVFRYFEMNDSLKVNELINFTVSLLFCLIVTEHYFGLGPYPL